MAQSPLSTARPQLSGAGGRPAVGIVFDDVQQFRRTIGVELFENCEDFAPVVAVHDAIMPVPLPELLWYRAADAEQPDELQRLAAVITVSMGVHEVFARRWSLQVRAWAGVGIGCVSAAIAAGSLDLAEALSWVAEAGTADGQDAEAVICERAAARLAELPETVQPIRLASAGELAEAGSRPAVDAWIDLGPGDAAAAALRAHPAFDLPVGAVDSPRNRLHIYDQLQRSRFCNAAYLAERTLAQIVITRNLLPDSGGHATVVETAKALKQLIRREQLPREWPSGDPAELFAGIRSVIAHWIANGKAKGYSAEQILDSVIALEHETLFPLRAICELTAEHIDAFDMKEISRAS